MAEGRSAAKNCFRDRQALSANLHGHHRAACDRSDARCSRLSVRGLSDLGLVARLGEADLYEVL